MADGRKLSSGFAMKTNLSTFLSWVLTSCIVNQARAMRISEIMTDFRNLQNYIASIRAAPSAEEYNEDGFVLLRHCEAEAKSLLHQGFQMSGSQRADEEQQKAQLRRYVDDGRSVMYHRLNVTSA
jgi:hypothetical protein